MGEISIWLLWEQRGIHTELRHNLYRLGQGWRNTYLILLEGMHKTYLDSYHILGYQLILQAAIPSLTRFHILRQSSSRTFNAGHYICLPIHKIFSAVVTQPVHAILHHRPQARQKATPGRMV
jgi:hypothetical protein